MAQSYSTAILNRHLAPEISSFTVFEAPDISEKHKEAPYWIANHFLNSVFRSSYKNKFRQYAVNQLYRAQVAFTDYHEARIYTGDYLKSGRPDRPAIQAYFRALSRWESCLLNLHSMTNPCLKLMMARLNNELGASQTQLSILDLTLRRIAIQKKTQFQCGLLILALKLDHTN
jgi:hypothetical protein